MVSHLADFNEDGADTTIEGFHLQVRLKRPTGYAVLALEMFDVLIYCSACQRHQVGIRYSELSGTADMRSDSATLRLAMPPTQVAAIR